LLLASCSSCVRKPGRPDIPVCTINSIDADCTDLRGDYKVSHGEILGTTIDGYGVAENYVDQLELRVRQLERQIAQGCSKENVKTRISGEARSAVRTSEN
jgi:hypothetical protein